MTRYAWQGSKRRDGRRTSGTLECTESASDAVGPLHIEYIRTLPQPATRKPLYVRGFIIERWQVPSTRTCTLLYSSIRCAFTGDTEAVCVCKYLRALYS